MTALHHALHLMWQSFGLPAYLDGCLPQGAPLPRIHYTLASPPAASPALLTATAWFSGEDAALRRTALADTLRAAFPEGGRMLRFEGGYALLWRSGDFITCESDPADAALRGLRIRLELRLYAM